MFDEKTAARFWAKVNKNGVGGCWLWVGAISHGYGNFWGNNSYMRASRASWVLHYGAIPNGLLVCHRCDIGRCVNPAHLFLGTHKDNTRDMIRKGRLAPAERTRHAGEGHGMAKITWKDVRAIRRLYATGKYSLSSLGRIHGMTHTNITRIVRNKLWKE